MIANIRSAWRRFRSRTGWSLSFDVALILAVFMAVHAWQTRKLPVDEPAPTTVLALLEGGGSRPAIEHGGAGVVYFFAPWCFVCRSSIGNLDRLLADGRVSWATAVALDYSDEAEVRSFVDRTGITLPVLLGRTDTAAEWAINAFPTYFVVAADGNIDSRSVGYSTTFGIRLRAWLAE